MEKIGLITKFFNASSANWEAALLLSDSIEQQELAVSLRNTLCILKEISESRDIQTILQAENLSLLLELENHGNSPEEKNSISSALQQIAEANKSLCIVKNEKSYCDVAETYSTKRKEGGLPLDSFREFLKSHATRLTNRLAAPLSTPEKNILRQRKENLKVARELYIEMQRTALGLPSHLKAQDIER